MTFTLNNYIETISNPNGRFRTLDGIYSLTDGDGNPEMYMDKGAAMFKVVYGGHHYWLACPLDCGPDSSGKLKEISLFTKLVDSPYLAPFDYLEKEMLVFGHDDDCAYVDVSLHRIPDGEILAGFLDKNAGADFPVSELLTNVAALAKWLAANNVSHGRISSHNITVNNKLVPVLTDCGRISRRDPRACVSALGALAAVVYITGCEPRFYAYFKNKGIFRRSGETQRLASALADIRKYLEADAPETLKELLNILSDTNGSATTDELCGKAEALANCPLVDLPDLTVFLDGIVPGKFANHTIGDKFSRYEFVGELRDMLMRADDGHAWVYLDRNGNVAIKGGFVDAQDFCEGRAIVETETGFGVIDNNGRLIIAPEYEDIVFDEPTNMFIVTMDGYSALYTREGEKVTETDYSRIMDSSEGLFVVEKNGAYGYICKDGSVAVGVIYDDAMSFSNGTGRVVLRGRTYLIDSEGNFVEEITEARKERAPIFI